MFKILTFLFFIIYLFTFMSACSTINKSSEPIFLELIIGSGGGSTGFINGFTLDSSGRVFQWNGRTINDNQVGFHSIKNDSINKIFEIVKKFNLMELKYEQPDNFFRLLQFKTNENVNYIAWGLNSDSDTVKTLNEIYESIILIINSSN